MRRTKSLQLAQHLAVCAFSFGFSAPSVSLAGFSRAHPEAMGVVGQSGAQNALGRAASDFAVWSATGSGLSRSAAAKAFVASGLPELRA